MIYSVFLPVNNFIFKIFGRPLARRPLEVVSRSACSLWRIYWFNCISAVDMEIQPTALNEDFGSIAVEIPNVGCVIEGLWTLKVT